MRRHRANSLGLVFAVILLASSASTAAAASVSFANSYAGVVGGFGDGSITYQASSGVSNFLRATASANVVMPSWANLSTWSGRMTSSAVKYTGATNGSITVKLNGTFTRDLSGGFSLVNGAAFYHQIVVALRDQSTATDIRSWNYVSETILCGGLAYPIGAGGCNGATSDTYPSSVTKLASGSGIVNGHNYVIRVYVVSDIDGGGAVFGLQGRTTARDMTGSLNW
jgi:hypothetical protein